MWEMPNLVILWPSLSSCCYATPLLRSRFVWFFSQDYVALCAAIKQSALQTYTDRESLKENIVSIHEHPAMEICLKHKLFEGHSRMHLGVMLAKSQAKEMQEGDVLFNLGDKGTSLFILLSGEVACIARDGTEVQVLEAGTVFFVPVKSAIKTVA